MQNNRRQNSATAFRAGSQPLSSLRPATGGPANYLKPTNSSAGHSKKTGHYLNTIGGDTTNNNSALAKRPPSASGAAAPLADRPPSAAGGTYNDAQFNSTNASNTYTGTEGSVARTIYRPSAILLDKINHGQAPPLAPIDSPNRLDRAQSSGGYRVTSNVLGGDGLNHGNFHPSSAVYGNTHVNGTYQDQSAAFNATGASQNSILSNASVGAKDLLRYKESLKTRSPSAMAVEATKQQLLIDQEKERVAKLEYREQWRRSVEEQLAAKAARRQEERARGLKERTVIEDRYYEEREANAAKKRQMANEIQRQKFEDEQRAMNKALEAVERARKERAQMDAQVRQMEIEKKEALVTKVKTQREILSQANALQKQKQEERMQSDAERKFYERKIADEAKADESRENQQIRIEQKNRQREVLEQSRTLSTIKNLNDTRAQMEYEAALEQQKRATEDREAREKREAREAKHRLSQQLRQQMHDRQESRLAERKRTIEMQRQAADEESRAAWRASEEEKQRKAVQQSILQRELETQMMANMNKALVDLVQN